VGVSGSLCKVRSRVLASRAAYTYPFSLLKNTKALPNRPHNHSQPTLQPTPTLAPQPTGSNATTLPLKLFIRGERNNYCGSEPALSATPPAATAAGGWLRYVIPMSAFNCYELSAMTHIELQNTFAIGETRVGSNATFCLGDFELVM